MATMIKDIPVRVGVGVVIKKGDTILMGRRLGKNGKDTWSMPGGHLDNGETPEQTAIRETQEETGLTVSNPRFIGYTNDIFPEKPGKHYLTLWFCAAWTVGNPVATSEMDELTWAALDSLPEPLFLPLQNLMQSPFWQSV